MSLARQITNFILLYGNKPPFKLDLHLETALMNLFLKLGDPSFVTRRWTELHKQLLHQPTNQTILDIVLNPVVLTIVLRACSDIGWSALQLGKQIHEIATDIHNTDIILQTALIGMYSKCGEPDIGLKIWKNLSMASRDFSETTYISVLTACANSGTSDALEIGMQIQTQFFGNLGAPSSSVKLYSALINMFTKCGKPETALQLWKRVSSFVQPNSIMYICVLSACSNVNTAEGLAIGKDIHTSILKRNKARIFWF